MRTVIIVLAVSSALLLGGLTLGGTTKPPADAPPPQAVTVAAVPEQAVTEWDEFTGRLEAVDQVEIRPRVSGYIRRVAFTEGREVKKGEVLFEIDPRPYEAELARVEAELESARSAAALAKSEVQRAGTLVDDAGDLAGGVRQPDQRRGPGWRAGSAPRRRRWRPLGSIWSGPRSALRLPAG